MAWQRFNSLTSAACNDAVRSSTRRIGQPQKHGKPSRIECTYKWNQERRPPKAKNVRQPGGNPRRIDGKGSRISRRAMDVTLAYLARRNRSGFAPGTGGTVEEPAASEHDDDTLGSYFPSKVPHDGAPVIPNHFGQRSIGRRFRLGRSLHKHAIRCRIGSPVPFDSGSIWAEAKET